MAVHAYGGMLGNGKRASERAAEQVGWCTTLPPILGFALYRAPAPPSAAPFPLVAKSSLSVPPKPASGRRCWTRTRARSALPLRTLQMRTSMRIRKPLDP